MKLKNNWWFKILPFVYVSIALLVGLFLGYKINNDPEISQEKHELGYFYISPLLECYSEKSESPQNAKIKNGVERIIQRNINNKNISSASVYFRDLANGPWFGINEDENFTPASLLKVSILISYYKIAENNPEILKQKILAEDDYVPSATQNILPTRKIEIGKEYLVNDLLDLMITDSSNHAAHLLLKLLPESQESKTYYDLGIKEPNIEQSENYMSVKDYSSFFRILYNASYLNKEYSEKALRLLSNSKYKKALVAGVPENTIVAHKFGERENNDLKQLHDCGVIYKYNKHYLLCVMTRGNDFNILANVIKEISKNVYEEVN